jgi:hypothetical protein
MAVSLVEANIAELQNGNANYWAHYSFLENKNADNDILEPNTKRRRLEQSVSHCSIPSSSLDDIPMDMEDLNESNDMSTQQHVVDPMTMFEWSNNEELCNVSKKRTIRLTLPSALLIFLLTIFFS